MKMKITREEIENVCDKFLNESVSDILIKELTKEIDRQVMRAVIISMRKDKLKKIIEN